MNFESRFVYPNSPLWRLFLDMTYQYLTEGWPDRVKGMSENTFKAEYEQLLNQRFEQGGRGLFIYYKDDKAIGFSNAYISEEHLKKVLNIVEFYVSPLYRKQGFATQMKDHLIQWGREQSASKLKIVTDKNQELSNRFWSSFGFDLDRSGSRNVYSTRIT